MKKLKSFLQRAKEVLICVLLILACIVAGVILLVVCLGAEGYAFIARKVFGKEVDIRIFPEEDYLYDYGY